ncbi:hypothetical protein [Pseudomonas baetica]|uniref:hypothetical protein n=1 Tax=Pseudomonas baetica TaxID=674054 RepID=UPI0021AB54D0|nr:hypothetical protein [Pseudomonas baetica]
MLAHQRKRLLQFGWGIMRPLQRSDLPGDVLFHSQNQTTTVGAGEQLVHQSFNRQWANAGQTLPVNAERRGHQRQLIEGI